ncbi:MAG: hypothetical protein WBB29_15300 [Geitlerinemataceae cyanobacterium]
MLKNLLQFPIVASLLFLSTILISGCSQTASIPEKTSSETQTDPNSNIFNTPISTAKQSDNETLPNRNDIELLYGKWKPIAYIDPNGQQTDLTALPESQQATLSWEFTPEGTVKLGEIEGSFEVEGNQIVAKNESSGNERRFEFSVSETELTIVSDDGAILKLARE